MGKKKEWSTDIRYNINFEHSMLSERNQTPKPSSIWFHLYEIFKIDKSIQTENRWVVSRGQGAGEEWLTVMGMDFILGGNEKVLKLDSSAGFTALWIYENAGWCGVWIVP